MSTERKAYKTGFCGGYSSPPNHERCPKIVRNGDRSKSWLCECDCHLEETHANQHQEQA